MAQRISRAKQSIKAAGAQLPAPARRRARRSARAWCCTCCTWSSTRATRPRRATPSCVPTSPPKRSGSPVWCTRCSPTTARSPASSRSMLLTDARRRRAHRHDGALVPLDEQDRARWDHALIARGRRRWSPMRSRTHRSVRTSCRRRSPRCTTKRPVREPPTGARSSRSTSCSTASHPTRWRR